MADYDRMSDAEVYERVATALNIFPVYDDTPPQVADFARRRVLDAMVEQRGFKSDVRRDPDEESFAAFYRAASCAGCAFHRSPDRAICIAALMALEAEGE